jgi:hypothetical protein
VQDLGYGDAATRKWVSAVMSRLQVEAEKGRWALRMRSKLLYRELIRAGSDAAANDSLRWGLTVVEPSRGLGAGLRTQVLLNQAVCPSSSPVFGNILLLLRCYLCGSLTARHVASALLFASGRD